MFWNKPKMIDMRKTVLNWRITVKIETQCSTGAIEDTKISQEKQAEPHTIVYV